MTDDWRYLWPDHGVEGTPGARIAPEIVLITDLVFDKGTDARKEAYSAFDGLDQHGRSLERMLRSLRIKRLAVGGLATDYCVRATVLDGLQRGFDVTFLASASRGISPSRSPQAIADMIRAGAHMPQLPPWQPGDGGAALIVVDVQGDFLPGGSLAVPGGDLVIPELVAEAHSGKYQLIVASRDLHPPNHQSFKSAKRE